MHRTLRRLGVAALFASSFAFAQTTGKQISPPSTGPAATAQADAMSKVSSSVKKAYSEIDKAKGVLSGSSADRKNSAASWLGKAEHELGTAKSGLAQGGQQQGTQLIDAAREKVASARTHLQNGQTSEAQKALSEVPSLASVEKSLTSGLSGATGIGGSGTGTPPPPGSSPTR